MGSLEDDLTEYHRMNKRDEEIETLRKRVAELEEQTHNLREVVLLKARDAEQAEAQLAEAKERCKAAEELVLTPAGNIYAKLAEVKVDAETRRKALENATNRMEQAQIERKRAEAERDVMRDLLQEAIDWAISHPMPSPPWFDKARAALNPSPAGREG